MMWQAATILLSTAIVALVVWDWWQRGKLNRRIAELTATAEQRLQSYRQLEEHAKAERQTLFNSMGEGVILLDRHGRIQLVNQSLERQFGLSIDVRGHTLMEALRLPELATLMEKLQTERVLTCEVERAGKESHYFEVSAAAVLDREGEPRGAILVFHDLTHIRQLENTRRE